MLLISNIRKIKLISFSLFIIALTAILLPIFLFNHLVTYTQSNFVEGKFNEEYICDKNSNWCNDNIKRDFTNCSKFKYLTIYDDTSFYYKEKGHLKETDGTYTDFNLKKTNEINKSCIKNSLFYYFYKSFPEAGKKFLLLKSKTSFPSSISINPFLYGELSISNLVKRFPFNLIFKPLMLISAFLMILFWTNYNHVFNKILNQSKKNIFFYSGVTASILLILHTLLLGLEIDNNLFKILRKFIIIFFIIFEVCAEFFLVKNIFNNRKILSNYMYNKVIFFKVIFISILLLGTLFMIILLIVSNETRLLHNIFEWNYFLFLIFFYFLSCIVWKSFKNNN